MLTRSPFLKPRPQMQKSANARKPNKCSASQQGHRISKLAQHPTIRTSPRSNRIHQNNNRQNHSHPAGILQQRHIPIQTGIRPRRIRQIKILRPSKRHRQIESANDARPILPTPVRRIRLQLSSVVPSNQRPQRPENNSQSQYDERGVSQKIYERRALRRWHLLKSRCCSRRKNVVAPVVLLHKSQFRFAILGAKNQWRNFSIVSRRTVRTANLIRSDRAIWLRSELHFAQNSAHL